MDLTIQGYQLHAYSLPYRLAWNSQSESRTVRQGQILLLEGSNGLHGRGELLFWDGFGEGKEETERGLRGLAGMLRDAGPLTSPFTETWQTMLEELPSELAASVEMAALDLLGQASGTPIARLLHPASSLKPVEERKFWSEAGPTQRSKWLKVKAAKSIRDTCSILATLRSGAHPNASLVVDANQGWTKEDWKSHSELLLKFGPVWVEEPFPQWWTDSAVRGTELPIVMDESLLEDKAPAIARMSCVRGLTVKPSFLGGFYRVKNLLERIEPAKKTVFFSSALGTQLERAYLVHCAAAWNGSAVLGLGPLLQDEGYMEQIRSSKDGLEVPRSPGLGLRSPSLTRYPVGKSPLSWGDSTHPRWLDEQGAISAEAWDRLVQEKRKVLSGLGVAEGHFIQLATDDRREFALRYQAVRSIGAIAVPVSTDREHVGSSRREWLDGKWGNEGLQFPVRPKPMEECAFPTATNSSPVATVMHTSGSTGVPKSRPISHQQWTAGAEQVCDALGVEKNDRWLLALPLDRVGGLAILERSQQRKFTVVLPRTLAPADVAEAIRQHAVTLVSVVPTQLQGLLNEGPHLLDALRGLKTVFVGGGPMPEILQQKLLNEGISFHRSWGMTEAASTVCIAVKDSSARPLPGLLVEESPFGLIVGGPQIGGFHCTGDVGHVDSDGNVLIEGRIDDVLISGGVNVSANRIATELTEHPDVSDAVVLGIPDERWGQRVVAVVQSLELESMPCASVLKKWARARLKREECPKDIFVVSRDLRDQMGKVRADEWSSWLQQAGKGGE